MTTPVVPSWYCIPPLEQDVNTDMASAYGSMTQFVAKTLIDAKFLAAFPSWWQIRRDAWIACYNIHEDTVIIDELEIPVYLAINTWMSEVYACQLTGGCLLGQPVCPQLDFINSPA